MKRIRPFIVFFVAMWLFVIVSACGNTTSGSSTNNKSQYDKESQNKIDSSNHSSKGVSVTKNNGNRTYKDSTSSKKSSTKSNNSVGIQFDVTIDQAMQYVQKRSKMSLMAPAKPIFTSNGHYMGAQVSVKKNSYSVSLLSTEKRLPINSPLLSSPQFEQTRNIIGLFGGTVYQSSNEAKAQLYQTPANDLSPAYQSPPKSSFTKVDLGKGITGIEYSGTFPMVEWHEGKWTFQVWDGTEQQDIQEARNIVAYLDTHLLPQTYGVFGENIAGDGYHTSVEWVYGNTLYSCFSYHSGIQAAAMAVSTRVYPSGQTKP